MTDKEMMKAINEVAAMNRRYFDDDWAKTEDELRKERSQERLKEIIQTFWMWFLVVAFVVMVVVLDCL